MKIFVQYQGMLRSISRHAKNLTGGICLIFRGLNFEHNAEIGRKGHF